MEVDGETDIRGGRAHGTSIEWTMVAPGVRVLWFQTWGHLNGFPDVGHTSYTSMQDQVSATLLAALG